MTLTIHFKKLHEDAVIPKYAHEGDAGMDLHAIDSYIIPTRESMLIKTGLSLALPQGYEAQVRPRSGLALKNQITVLNSPGTIDSGYRGEVGVILVNHSRKTYEVKKGDRIAQLIIARHESPRIEEIVNLEESVRGEAGFGSTGK
jgi:dUTP pyrophosphatase